MAVSIFHRLTGDALGIGGVLALVFWLTAAASGKESYDWFVSWASWWPFKIVLILLTWSFFQHLCSGLRHFVMDAGAGYEMKSNRTWSLGVFLIAFFLTATLAGSSVFCGVTSTISSSAQTS